jgi:hypothetical protein
MRGKVAYINQAAGMVAIATVDSGFTIIELTGDDEIDQGDEMQWNGKPLGDAVFFNLTKGSEMNVYAQNHDVNQQFLAQQLLL